MTPYVPLESIYVFLDHTGICHVSGQRIGLAAWMVVLQIVAIRAEAGFVCGHLGADVGGGNGARQARRISALAHIRASVDWSSIDPVNCSDLILPIANLAKGKVERMVRISQERLNFLWLAMGGVEIEALRVRPFVDVDGFSALAVYRSGTVQTMVVSIRECEDQLALGNPEPETYIRRRDAEGLQWGAWKPCGEEVSG